MISKEEIVRDLRRRIFQIQPDVHVSHNGKSNWSLTFSAGKKSNAQFLKSLFNIDIENWDEKFNEATSGIGQESQRILTLHSSALLALLTFVNISRDNPLLLLGEKYIKSWFEVKNVVIEGRNPSSVDVLLQSESGNLLFIESKFTEYLEASSPNIVEAYKPIYDSLLPLIDGMPLQMFFPKKFTEDGKEIIGFGLKPKSERRDFQNLYLTGIKQSISHLIGISKGPSADDNSQWSDNIEGKTLRYGTILYRLKSSAFGNYKNFYHQTIGNITSDKLAECLNGHNAPFVKQIEVLPNLLTYQEVFGKSGFKLPERVKYFYHL